MADAELQALLSRYDAPESLLLIQVPQIPLERVDLSVARNQGYFAYLPQGLLQLAAIAEPLAQKRGAPVRILDLNYELLKSCQTGTPNWRAPLEQALAEMPKPLVGISLMFEATLPAFGEVARAIRALSPRSLLIAGGVHATADADLLLKEHPVDLVVRNEGEGPFRELLTAIWEQVPASPGNLTFRGAAGRTVQTDSVVRINEPVPDVARQYSRIPVADYHRVGSLSVFSRMVNQEGPTPFATVIAKRGCRAHCTFCGVRGFNGRGVRARPPSEVLAEMRVLRNRFGVRHFDWLDDDLLFDRESTLTLFEGIAETLPDVTWAANNGLIPAALTPDLLDAMRRSHCLGFKIGLETGNEEMLRKVGKPITLRKLAEFSHRMRDYPELFASTNIILGLPGETFGQMLDSLRASVRYSVDWTNFYIFQPIKNTAAYEALGGMGDHLPGGPTDHGRDNSPPIRRAAANFNPVRGGAFTRAENPLELLASLPTDRVPNRQELSEIWFAFNLIANFLKMPAMELDAHPRKRANGQKFLAALAQAYPGDPLMKLQRSLFSRDPGLVSESRSILERDSYWSGRFRDYQLSSLFEGQVPEIPAFARAWLAPTTLSQERSETCAI